MLRHLVLLLLLRFALCWVTLYPHLSRYRYGQAEQEKARRVIAAMLKKFEGNWASFIRGDQPFFIQSPCEDQLVPTLPNDIWLENIISHVVKFDDMLVLGQVCKALNFVIRKNYFDAMMECASIPLAQSLAQDPSRELFMLGMSYMEELLNEGRRNKIDLNELSRLRLQVYRRTKDLAVVQKAYYYCNNTASFPMVPEAEEIVQGLRVVKGSSYHPSTRDIERQKETQYIWLPDNDDGMPLLERFDPRTPAAMLGNHICTFRTMFFPHLLAQYIIPTYRKEKGMTVKALQPFKDLMRPNGFFEYFHYLYRALYILEGDFKTASRDKSSKLFKISKFLKSLGFKTSLFAVCRPGSAKWSDDKYKVEEEMWSIIRVAQHWGLKWKKIAKKTQDWCQLSKRIIHGETIDGLHPLDLVTPHDVFKVAFWNETEVVRPSYKIVDGIVVLDAVEEKRKRIRERNNERQRDRKRRKLEENAEGKADNFQEEVSDEEEGDVVPPPWRQPPMPFAQMPDFQPMPAFLPTAFVVSPVPQQAPVLPQLRLDHAAFLAPPQGAMAMPLQAHQAPMRETPQTPTRQALQELNHKAGQVTIQILEKRASPAAADQSETAILGCKFIGTPEQVRLFHLGCLRLGQGIADKTGMPFCPQGPTGESIPNPFTRPLATIGQAIPQGNQQPSVAPQQHQQPLIVPTAIGQFPGPVPQVQPPLESPYFINPSELNQMDIDDNGSL